jgi:hypothetical protein
MLRNTFRRTLAAAAALIVVSCAGAGVAQAGGPLGALPVGGLLGPVNGAGAGLTQVIPPQVGALLPVGG